MSSAVVGDTEGGPPPSHLSLPADIRARYRGWSPAPPIVIRGSGVAVCDSLTFACWPDAQSPSPEFYEVHDEHLQRVSLVAVYPLPPSVHSMGISRLPATSSSSSSNGGRTAQTTGLDPQQYATQEVRDDVHLSKFLTHPRFPRVYHTHSLPNALLVVSPKHTGGSLVDWLCQRRVDGQLVDATVVQRLMKCVLQGLDALHSEALVHRGITHHALIFPEVDARGREVQGEGGSATCQGGTEASVKLGHLRGVAVVSHVRPEDECGPSSMPCRRRAPHSSSCQQHRPDLHDTAYHGNLLYTAPEILRTMLLPLPQHTGDAAAEAQYPKAAQADDVEALPVPDRGRACVSDMWSVGVLCHLLLSGHFPFEEAQRVEVEEGKWETIVASRVPTPWDLVQRLTRKGVHNQEGGYDSYLAAYRDALAVRGGLPPGNHFQWLGGSREATDFVVRCLTVDPALRLTAREALKHPWMTATAFGREQWESSDQRGSTATHQLKRQLHRLCERLLPSNTSTAFVSLLESSRRPSGEGPLPPLFLRCDGWMEDMILHEGATAWLGAERELIAAFVQRTEERRQELAVAKDPYAHISLTTSDSSCSASASTGQKMISSRIVAAPSVAAAGAAAKPSRSCDTLLSELLVGRYTVPACLPSSAAAFSYLSQLDLSLGCTHFLGEAHCISLLLSLRASVHTAARLSTLRLCQQGVSDRVLEAWRVDLCEAAGSPSSVPSRLVPFSQLRVLDFSSNIAVTAEGVRTLTRLVRWRGGALFPQLEQVDCSGCAVSDTVLRKVGAAVRSSSSAVQ